MKKTALEGHELNQFLHSYLNENRPDMDKSTRQTVRGLGEDAGKGLEALQYLTGHKKKEVETFYDAHPGQAVGQDIVNKLPAMGAGAIAGHAGHSMLKDFLLKRELGGMKKNYGKKDGIPHVDESVNRSDVKEIFGQGGVGGKNRPYAETYNNLERMKPKLKGMQDEQITRLMSSEFPSSVLEKGEHADAGKFKGMISHLFSKNDSNSAHLAKGVSERVAEPSHHVNFKGKKFNTGVSKNLTSHFNPKVLAGGGAAIAGGIALAPLIKFIQRKVYGDNKVQDWKRNQDMTHGKFE